MSISSSRLAQLREEFIPVKNQIDKIDRKYSLDYVEPLIDMPESLNLPLMERVAKTDEQLLELADEQTYASYLANLGRLNASNASNMLKLDKQQLALEEKTRVQIAQLLNNLNQSINDVNVRITNAGMLFSTVAKGSKLSFIAITKAR